MDGRTDGLSAGPDGTRCGHLTVVEETDNLLEETLSFFSGSQFVTRSNTHQEQTCWFLF